MHPNTLRWLKFGFCRHHFSYGVCFSSRLLLVPCCVGMYCCYGFCPIAVWQFCVSNHSSSTLHQGSIHPFSNSIMGWMWNGQFVTNPFVFQILLKLFRDIFTTLVRSQPHYFFTALPCCSCLNFSGTSDLCRMKYTEQYREKASIKVTSFLPETPLALNRRHHWLFDCYYNINVINGLNKRTKQNER